MQEENKTLHLFTSQYPYGKKSETFIETEILYLSKKFSKIIVYPKVRKSFIREIPVNVEVNNFRSNIDQSKITKIRIIFTYFFTSTRILLREIIDKKTIHGFKFLLDYLSIQLLEFDSFKAITKSKNHVYYDYWFSNATLMLAVAKSKKIISNIKCRAHRFDIYDENWGEIGVPFRSTKIKKLSKIFVISNDGLKYLTTKTPIKYHSKFEISYLGVNKFKQISHSDFSNKKCIVSCSGVTKRKGVMDTIKLLTELNESIHWVHFGSGPDFEKLTEEIKNLPKNISVELKGHVSNKEITTYYQNHRVDLFLSLSKSEGIPVSMMEAISFGIPICAYGVGGIPEIVIPGVTGQIMIQNIDELKVIKNALHYPLAQEDIIDFYYLKFNAEKNYTDFITKLCLSEN